ncbi:hypothetical protein B0H63DRAFT_453743 [Podospora didyma]|uniref:Uncharacterized protein n=1 Tax=Podospora didyma TaxID=330526 RepID=A0AAE0K9K2_9PEZI|nr:hypothetical protein B0H63DRAFT_453743 [Podospora didyma]
MFDLEDGTEWFARSDPTGAGFQAIARHTLMQVALRIGQSAGRLEYAPCINQQRATWMRDQKGARVQLVRAFRRPGPEEQRREEPKWGSGRHANPCRKANVPKSWLEVEKAMRRRRHGSVHDPLPRPRDDIIARPYHGIGATGESQQQPFPPNWMSACPRGQDTGHKKDVNVNVDVKVDVDVVVAVVVAVAVVVDMDVCACEGVAECHLARSQAHAPAPARAVVARCDTSLGGPSPNAAPL